MNNSRVFLIAQPSVSNAGAFPKLTPLAKFGEVVVVVEGGDSPSFKPAEVYEKIQGKLADFDAENDYLVWAGGDTLSAVMVGNVLARQGHQSFQWLRFERGRDLVTHKRTDDGGTYTVVNVLLLNEDMLQKTH